MKLYLAGPMSTHTTPDGWDTLDPRHLQEMDHFARLYRGRGFHVYNPAETARANPDLTRTAGLAHGLRALANCQALVLLPGWENSAGVRYCELPAALAADLPVLDDELRAIPFPYPAASTGAACRALPASRHA